MSDTSAIELLPAEEPTAIEAIEKAQIDCQISTAKRYPRTLSKVKADMLSFATLDEDTALSCFYTLPRGGKTIQGPSVRLAEIAISCYMNLRVGARPIQTVTSGDHPHVIIQAVAHDLEKNVAITIEKRRRIVGKKKNNGAIDEDDINLAVNACAAIALRDATFKVVPLALIKPVYEQAKAVAVGDIKSLGVKRAKIVDRLTHMGAKIENILARVEASKVEDIDLSRLELLIGLGTALKDGETSLEEAFPAPEAKVEKPVFSAPPTKSETKKTPEKKPAEQPGTDSDKNQNPDLEDLPPPPPNPDPSTVVQGDVPAPAPSGTKEKLISQLENLLLDNSVTTAALLKWARDNKHVVESVKDLKGIPSDKVELFTSNFAKVVGAIKKS